MKKLTVLALLAVAGCAGARETKPAPAASTADAPSSAPPAPPPAAPPGVTGGTHDRTYTMAELEALDRREAYLEVVQHLYDLPPTTHDAAWDKLAVHASVGLLSAALRDHDAAVAVITADELTERYPMLMTYPAFAQKRAEVGSKGFTSCYEHSSGGASCTERLLRFVQRDPNDTELAMNAGRLVITKQFPYVAVRFFSVAVAGKKHPKECADPELQRAVAAAEDALLQGDPILAQAKSIRAICK